MVYVKLAFSFLLLFINVTSTGGSPWTNAKATTVVVGGGTIGSSFCAVFLAHGQKVTCCDPHIDEQALKERITKVWPILKARGLTSKRSPPFSLLELEKESLDPVTKATFIQECTYENIESKQKVLTELDQMAPPETIIASSTSYIPHDLLVAGCRNHPDRVIIGHPTIPYLDCLMEIYGTNDQQVAKALEWYQKSGFEVLVMHKTIPGHVFNTFLTLNMREGAKLVRQGVCSPQDVNLALRHMGREFYARHSYLTLLSTIGGDGGLDSGLAFSDSIKRNAVSIVFYSLFKKCFLPHRLAQRLGQGLSRLLADSIEPPAPDETLMACRQVEDRVTQNGKLNVQTGLFQASASMYRRMPYEVGNDPFQF